MANSPNNGYPWINPIGGLGDQLMLSGVLKLVHDRFPDRRFNLIRRTGYLAFLKGHPAIAAVGWPEKGLSLARNDYWSMEELGPEAQRPFQVLARAFGLKTPVDERLYLPGENPTDPILMSALPWKDVNILIAPSSDSPRKVMHPALWDGLVEILKREGMFVVQAGRLHETHIRPAYSALGLTTPRQLIGLLKRCSAVVTSDSFTMHAAHLVGTPAVVLWGATNHEVYGYPEQIHLQSPKACGLGPYDDCIAPVRNDGGRVYGTPCPHGDGHCLDQLEPERIADGVRLALSASGT
jgi:ADP-heptose:LPS heptosyltransferase